jgi:hypothetical protein
MANSDMSAFDSNLGGWKTYLTAGSGIVFNFLAAFNIFSPTPEQMTAINGALVLLTVIFLRMGVKKAQASAAKAEVSAVQAAQQNSTANKSADFRSKI